MRVTPSFRLRRILPKKHNHPTTLKMNSFCCQSFIKVTQDTLHHEQSSWTTPTHITTHSREPAFALYPSRSAARCWGRGEGNKIASQVVRALRWDGRRGGGHLTAWICCFHSISLSTQARGERMSCRLDLAPWYRTCSMFVARWPAWARCPRWRSNTKLFVTLGRIFLSRVSLYRPDASRSFRRVLEFACTMLHPHTRHSADGPPSVPQIAHSHTSANVAHHHRSERERVHTRTRTAVQRPPTAAHCSSCPSPAAGWLPPLRPPFASSSSRP